MNNKDFKYQLALRYGKSLYLGYSKGNIYHFLYAYKRILVEIMKSLSWIFTGVADVNGHEEVAINATKNQKKALTNAKTISILSGPICHISRLSRLAGLIRLFTWVAKFVTYPIFFIFANDKRSLYFTLYAPLMRFYNTIIVKKLISSKINKIFLSNDHAGDIFIISILLRQYNDVTVSYVQHGAAKLEFPNNYFDEVFVYEKIYKDIYVELSLNPNVRIFVFDDMKGTSELKLESIDVLICLSHQFYPINIFKLLYLLKENNLLSISMRFHPSDRLAGAKLGMFNLFFNLKLSDSNINYSDDFRRAKLVVCASSSILLDAYNNNNHKNMVWLKCIGLSWDYYGLEQKIHTLDDLESMKKYLCGR